MKTPILFSASIILLAAGCQSTSLFPRFGRQDDVASSNTSSAAGLPPASQQSQVNVAAATDVPSQNVRIGNREIAAWYRDKDPSHLQTARRHFSEALREKPQNPDAHHGLAIVADLEKNFVEAVQHYEAALRITPNDSRVLGNLGYSYLLQGRLQESEQSLSRALAADPANQDALKHLADVYAKQGRKELALDTYRRVLNENEAQQALLANLSTGSGPASESNDSLWSRLSGKDKTDGEDPTLAIKRKMEEERFAAQMRREQPGGAPTAGRPAPYPHSQLPRNEQELKEQLAAIDAAQTPATGQPIIIGDTPPAPWAQRGAPVQMSQQGTGQPSLPMHAGQPAMAGSDTHGTGPVGTAAAPMAQMQPHSENRVTPAGASDSSMASSVPPLAFAGGPDVNNAPSAAPQNGIGTPAAQSPTSPGMQAWPQGGIPPEVSATHQPAPANAAPLAGNQQRSANVNQLDAMTEATRAAARLGMGAGPGPVFPVFQPARHSAPGTSSTTNGLSYPTPSRSLPTDLPPQDLNQAFQPQGSNATSGQAGIDGQQQFGTASRYAPPAPPTMPQPQMPTYDSQRAAADSQLNGAIQQAWGQRTAQPNQVNHASATAPSYGGPPMTDHRGFSMNSAGGTTTPSSQTQYAGTPAPQGATSYGSAPPAVRAGVVTPEPYPTGPASSTNGTGAPSPSAGYDSYNGPIVVPGEAR